MEKKLYKNVGYIKFLAAILVIVSHAFPLSTGSASEDWLVSVSANQITLGGLAVSIFFFYSGFFISKSVMVDNHFIYFFKKRILKIFPVLFCVISITIMILGPILSTLPYCEYMSQRETYLFFLNAILIPYHNLPGVFENNIYGRTVNGALWTLPVEFMCYVYIYVLSVFKYIKKEIIRTFVCVGCLLLVLKDVLIYRWGNEHILLSIIFPFLMFNIGIYYQIIREKVNFNKCSLYVVCIIIFISNIIGLLQYGLIIGLPYLLLYLGVETKEIRCESILKNISYHIYLCGFTIQQIVVEIFGGRMDPYINIIISIPFSIMSGVCLYYLENFILNVKAKKSSN